jgi:hypothetical protein
MSYVADAIPIPAASSTSRALRLIASSSSRTPYSCATNRSVSSGQLSVIRQ